MPSLILGQPVASGPNIIVSGNPWSGKNPKPVDGVQLRWMSSGGNAFIGLSGNFTVTSGGFLLSGGTNSGLGDGMFLAPGDSYFLPKAVCGLSGTYNVFATCDVAASGVGRLFFEVY